MITNATASNAPFASELIYQSGPASFDHVFSEQHGGDIKVFLEQQFRGTKTMFSHKRHYVYQHGNNVIGTIGLTDKPTHLKCTAFNAWHIFKHYGIRSIYKGLLFEHRLVKAPKNHCLYLYHIAVNVQHQGKGIAKALIKFAEQQAKAQQYEHLSLDVAKKNQAALSLYLNLGFKVIKSHKSYHHDLDDHLYMVKTIH